MPEITWPIAVAFISSISVICISVIKIFQIRKEKVAAVSPLELEEKLNPMRSQLAVQGTLLKEVMEDQRHQEEHLHSLNDQFIKILSD